MNENTAIHYNRNLILLLVHSDENVTKAYNFLLKT